MTKRDIFNKVSKHLLEQNQKAWRDQDNSQCAYRQETPTGVLKCAVGCLIDDSVYDPEMETLNIRDLVKNFDLPDYFSEHVRLLNDLQLIHDCRDHESWKEELIYLAKVEKLELPECLTS